MKCKIGDYVTDKFGNIFHVRGVYEKIVINTNNVATRYATEEEIKHFHEEIESLRSGDE